MERVQDLKTEMEEMDSTKLENISQPKKGYNY